MTLHEFLEMKIKAVRDRGLSQVPFGHAVEKAALYAIADHELALLEEFTADWPKLFAIEFLAFQEMLNGTLEG